MVRRWCAGGIVGGGLVVIMVVVVLVVLLWYSLLVRRPLCLLPLGWRKKTVSLTLDHSDEEGREVSPYEGGSFWTPF